MNLQERIKKYFSENFRPTTIKKLTTDLQIHYDDIDEVLDTIYKLECEGLIIGDDSNHYTHVPDNSIIKHGVVKRSAKKNLYLNLGHGCQVLLTDKSNAKVQEGDIVYAEIRPSSNHKKQYHGTVKRIVKRPSYSPEGTMLRTTILRDVHTKRNYIEWGKRYYILNQSLNGAYPGDEVTVFIKDLKDEYSVKVMDIIKRQNNNHVFECCLINGEKKWLPIGTANLNINIDIEPNSYNLGERILISLEENHQGKYLKDIPHADSLEGIIESIANDTDIPYEFPKEVLENAKNISKMITEEDISNRTDLRNLTTFTIDGSSAKDLDDAISLEVLTDRYVLYVHIADVTHYVTPGSPIFEEAIRRGTSIYPINNVIPMLPKELSNEVCSLQPHQDKLTKTCRIEISPDGEVLDYSIFDSIINSNCRMTYEKVNNLLHLREIDDSYAPYFKTLMSMHKLSDLLEERRLSRGYICFSSEDIDFDITDEGKVNGIINCTHDYAQQMIENFMLLANEQIASFAYYLKVPFIYRNHEAPNVDKLRNLKEKLQGFNQYINSINNASKPKKIQQILLKLFKGKTPDEIMMISKMLIRSMSRAYYDDSNQGHYALALENYATFTSPIRRLPDLLNHYIIGLIIYGKIEEADKYISAFADYAQISTETQLRADDFENTIRGIILQKYAQEFIDRELDARIIFICSDAIYVKTYNNLIGRLNINTNQIKKNILCSNKEKYRVGDDVVVKIDSIDEHLNDITFNLIKKNNKVLNRKR